MLTMYYVESIRSFIIVLYDSSFREQIRYQVPVSIAAPFANRLFRELPQVRNIVVHEPWYELVPRNASLKRSFLPEGPTSLCGRRFDPASQAPPAIHLHPNALMRSFEVHLLDYQTRLYEGVYDVDDLFLDYAHHVLHMSIKKGSIQNNGPHYYAIVPSAQAVYTVPSDSLPEDAYRVEGVFYLPPRVKSEPRIQFRPLPQPPLPETDPKRFGPTWSCGKGEPQKGQIFIPSRLDEELRSGLSLSSKIEEGGYLLGNVYRQPGSPEKEEDPEFRWIVEITDILMAEGAVGSPARLLFTGDSWSGISRRRDRDFRDRKLVGWFHTHLFPAGDHFGLSGLDLDMHAWYLPKPWQVAVLLNLEQNGDRTVRCYQRGPEGDLVETVFEVF